MSDINAENRVIELLDDAYANRINDIPKSLNLVDEALKLSEEVGNDNLKAKCLNHMSLFKMIQGNYSDAIKLAEEALIYFKKTSDEPGIAGAKYNLAGAYYKTDDFHRGLSYLIDCLKIYRKFNDYHNQARVQKSMGTIYEYYEDPKSAVEAYENSVEMGVKAGDKSLQSNAYNPLSGIYLNRGEIEKALDLIEKAISMKEETGDVRGLAFSLYGRAKVYTKMGEFEKAEVDYLESVRIHKEMGEKLGLGMAYHKLGAMYKEKGDFVNAKNFLQQALDFAKENRIILILFKANFLLYEIYKEESDLESALSHLEEYHEQKQVAMKDHTTKFIDSYESITRMERLEKESEVQREKADIIERKNLELDSLFYRISHDLKGPISSMVGMDFMAREEFGENEKIVKFLDDIKFQVYRINSILDQLIKVAQIKHIEERVEEIDFEKMIWDCILSFQYMPNYDKLDIKVNIEDEIKLKTEWTLVNTIIQNLIENAIKYARVDQEKPFLKVTLFNKDESVHLEVEDNGIGISDKLKENVFSMFYRATNEMEGTGLGLYILKRAVEQLNGSISLQSEIGKGSKFIVVIPCKEISEKL